MKQETNTVILILKTSFFNGAGKLSKTASVTESLKVILVEFDTTGTAYDTLGDTTFTKTNFNNLFFSDNYTLSPSNETAFGSMKQYFNSVSNGNFILHGKILNTTRGNDIPNWVKINFSKYLCHNMFTHAGIDSLFKCAAGAAGLDTTTSTIKILCFIYAGNFWSSNYTPKRGLHPHGDNIPGTMYIMSEKTDTDPRSYVTQGEPANTKFSHIGTHCHEFGHVLGLIHPDDSAVRWCVMLGGDYNGPRVASCPSPFNPVYRANLGWLTYNEINTTQLDKQIMNGYSYAYKLKDFCVNDSTNNNHYFIIEHRKVESYNRYYIDHELQNNELGLFIWDNSYGARLKNADGYFYSAGDSINWQINSAVLDAFGNNNFKINDKTSPKWSSTNDQYIYLNDITNSNAFNYDYSLVDVYINHIQDGLQHPQILATRNYDYCVGPDETYTVTSGVFFKLCAGKKFDVYGTLNMRTNSKITKAAASNWSGLSLQSGGTLDIDGNCIIEYASNGINMYGGTIDNGTNRITFQNCTDSGIYIHSCSPTIQEIIVNGITGGLGGICIDGSTSAPILHDVTIDGCSTGLQIGNYADGTLYRSKISGNSSESIYLGTINANLFMNYASGNGDNYIDPDDGANIYAIRNNSLNGNIDAENNYWGTDTPTSSLFATPAYVDFNPYYDGSDDLPAGYGAGKISSDIVQNPFGNAIYLEENGDLSEAYNGYKKILTETLNNKDKRRAIKSMLCVQDKSLKEYISLRLIIENELTKEETTGVYRAIIDFILCDLSVREGNYQSAIDSFIKKAENYKNTSMEVEMLSRVAEIYGVFLTDINNSKIYADKAASINPGQPILRSAYIAVGIEYNPALYTDKFKDVAENFDIQSEPEKPASEELTNSVLVSPNPFNPITTISYSIAASGHVTLAVYNITGQKVASLVNGNMGAGNHSVSFDGSSLASGVYFYRFEAGKFNKTGKMLLVK